MLVLQSTQRDTIVPAIEVSGKWDITQQGQGKRQRTTGKPSIVLMAQTGRSDQGHHLCEHPGAAQ